MKKTLKLSSEISPEEAFCKWYIIVIALNDFLAVCRCRDTSWCHVNTCRDESCGFIPPNREKSWYHINKYYGMWRHSRSFTCHVSKHYETWRNSRSFTPLIHVSKNRSKSRSFTLPCRDISWCHANTCHVSIPATNLAVSPILQWNLVVFATYPAASLRGVTPGHRYKP